VATEQQIFNVENCSVNQFIETLYKGDIVVRYIKQQIDKFFTIIKFPTSPL